MSFLQAVKICWSRIEKGNAKKFLSICLNSIEILNQKAGSENLLFAWELQSASCSLCVQKCHWLTWKQGRLHFSWLGLFPFHLFTFFWRLKCFCFNSEPRISADQLILLKSTLCDVGLWINVFSSHTFTLSQWFLLPFILSFKKEINHL